MMRNVFEQAWTVHACGGGVGLVNSHGRWLALDNNTTSTGAMIASVVIVNQSTVNCTDPQPEIHRVDPEFGSTLRLL
jgi:hypothetical protein